MALSQIFSWIALILGVSANFWAGTSKWGWFLNSIASVFWIMFGILIHVPAEWLASILFLVVGIRNFLIGRNNA